jgi:WD40 repeat protein
MGELGRDTFSVRFDYFDKYIAAGCKDGTIRIFNTATHKESYILNQSSSEKVPITGIRWRPLKSPKQTKNVLLSVNSNGVIQQWHTTSGKLLVTIKEETNELYCADYNEDGSKFATGGKDGKLRIYDEIGSFSHPEIILNGTSSKPGHNNRVFAIKFNVSSNPNLLASGGWDQKIIIWDLKTGEPVFYLQGTGVCGDSIDIVEDQLLAGSWRNSKQLQLFDLRKGDKIIDIDLIPPKSSHTSPSQSCFVYTAQLSKLNGNYALCGGSKLCQAYVINQSDHYKQVCSIYNISRPVYSVDFAHESNMFAITGGDGIIRLYDIKKKITE